MEDQAVNEQPSIASAEDFHDRQKPLAVGVDMAKGSDFGCVASLLYPFGDNKIVWYRILEDLGVIGVDVAAGQDATVLVRRAADQDAMDDAMRRPPAGEIPTIPPLSAEAWSRVGMADTRSKAMKRLMDQMCGMPRPDLGKAMREAEEEGAAVRRAMALLGTSANDDRLLLDLLCNAIEVLRADQQRCRDTHFGRLSHCGQAREVLGDRWKAGTNVMVALVEALKAADGNRSVDNHEAQGQIEHLDRENARLRRELAEANQRTRAVEQRLRGITFHANDAGELIRIDERDQEQRVVRVMWDKRERTAARNVILVEPFDDVKPRDDSWPPPSHRPRMLP